MTGPVERVQLKDGSVLKLNAEDRKVYEDQGLIGAAERAFVKPGPDDPTVAYDAGGDPSVAEKADALLSAKAVKKSAVEDKSVKVSE